MGSFHITVAAGDSDHLRDAFNGTVRIEGIEITHLKLPVEEIFYRFTKFREWDVSEMSFGKFASLVSQGDSTITALPVFPSRVFRQSAIYVHRDARIRTPRDLAGKRVGVPEWAQTAGIYVRGWLMHGHGLSLRDVRWYQAGLLEAGREEKVSLNLPPGVRLTPAPDQTLTQMLTDCELDAVISARPPVLNQEIIRLFPESRKIEEEYYRRTGIFPIMHVMVIRTDLLQRRPWIAMNLYKGFVQAKENSLQRLRDMTVSRFPVAWFAHHVHTAGELFGQDLWPYGIEANQATLEAFLQFALEQGVCHRAVAVEELFPQEVRSSVRV